MWCVPNLTPLFRERMDDILSLYTEPLPTGHEVHNFDETPKQLLKALLHNSVLFLSHILSSNLEVCGF